MKLHEEKMRAILNPPAMTQTGLPDLTETIKKIAGRKPKV